MEMDASKPMRPPTKKEETTSSLDTNDDGIISIAEYEAAVSEMGITDTDAADALFAKYDIDSNGIITSDELQAQQSTTVNSTNSTSDEYKTVSPRVLASYEANYQYMFETENSTINSIL